MTDKGSEHTGSVQHKDSVDTDDSKQNLIEVEEAYKPQNKRAQTYQFQIQRPLTQDSAKVENTLEGVDIDGKSGSA